MATVYVARIDRSDYEMIRGILNNDLPNSYDEWLKFQTKGERDSGGRRQTVGISIDPDELARYCGAHGGHRSRHGLLHFVMKKSEGENY